MLLVFLTWAVALIIDLPFSQHQAPHSWGFLFVEGWVDLDVTGYLPIIVFICLFNLSCDLIDSAFNEENLELDGSNKNKYCHVKGRIKFVEYPHPYDYAVKYASTFELQDLKVEFVNYDSDLEGHWRIVEYLLSYDFAIKIV